MNKRCPKMLKHTIKAVLFDLDGVLVDSIDAWFHLFNDTLKHFKLKTLSKKDFIKDFGAPIEHDVEKYFKGRTIKDVEDFYNTSFKRRQKYIKIFPHSIFVLDKLKNRKIMLGLITNSSRAITSLILNHFKLKKYFNVVITMDDVKRRKPSPDMILKACKILNVKPENTILIGDTRNDMLAGRKAGCIAIGYKIKGDYKIDNLREIESFIYV